MESLEAINPGDRGGRSKINASLNRPLEIDAKDVLQIIVLEQGGSGRNQTSRYLPGIAGDQTATMRGRRR